MFQQSKANLSYVGYPERVYRRVVETRPTLDTMINQSVRVGDLEMVLLFDVLGWLLVTAWKLMRTQAPTLRALPTEVT
jgi:hypothetical protein